MKTLITKALAKLTRKNVKWFVRVNVQGWLIQGVIVGTLTIAGVEAVAALVSAKVASWVVFLGQLVNAARSN